jgi:hypothetical protein
MNVTLDHLQAMADLPASMRPIRGYWIEYELEPGKVTRTLGTHSTEGEAIAYAADVIALGVKATVKSIYR